MKTKQNEEFLSRRGFFKKAAKGTLPMIALIGLSSVQTLFTSQAAAQGCQDCSGSCKGTCTNCTGDCAGGCLGCGNDCTGSCLNTSLRTGRTMTN